MNTIDPKKSAQPQLVAHYSHLFKYAKWTIGAS